uniref:Uncharacterized protein n=1 Tax=uncultured marine thaumarchaeote KM3_05_H05 TaxID=1455972 RepID=A0A075G9V1_9ARCH|nr:hypothetical protein [uncultured marine thaumarchaeote KM3_05_H05]
MVESKLLCYNCNSEIVEYYDEHYKGNRGKCTHCKIDFPLE